MNIHDFSVYDKKVHVYYASFTGEIQITFSEIPPSDRMFELTGKRRNEILINFYQKLIQFYIENETIEKCIKKLQTKK